MTDDAIKAESLLAIDLGAMNTRASLFDVVDGGYQFIATGSAMTTVDAPVSDASVGIFQAIRALQGLCGRTLLNGNRTYILPSQQDGSGVDRLVMTHSAGPRLKIVLAGLLDDFSLESARHLATSLPGEVVETIGLSDLRTRAMQLDAVLAARPDLMIIAGGTEGGASRSVYELVELAGLASQVYRDSSKPVVLYCGNQALVENVEDFLGRLTRIRISPNLRPSLSEENFGPALEVYSQTFTEIRLDQFSGVRETAEKCSVRPVPSAFGFGRIVRFLSQVYDPARGVMGIDLGSGSLTIAAAKSGDLKLRSFPFGMGTGMEQLIQGSRLDDFAKWIPFDLSDSDLRDMLYQMSLYPHRVPSSMESLIVSQAVARQALRMGIRKMHLEQPKLQMNFEPFLISGSILTQTPNPMSGLSVLLDGIQPVGVSTFVLDQNNLMAGLGAAAEVNSILPVQVLESGAFLNLGTVICPVSSARAGSEILQVRIEFEDGSSNHFEINKGSLLVLPVQNGQDVRVHIEGNRRTIIDPANRARFGSYHVKGGVCGVVIDARGRPVTLPTEKKKRHALLQKWNNELGL